MLNRVTLRIDNDDRIALLGANGNGKSTLVKLLANRLAPFSGTITRADKLAIAKPTLTNTADGLVAAGLLARETESTDRRGVRLRLTEAGRVAMRRADETFGGWLSELLVKAGEPKRTLADFAALDEAMDEMWMARRAARAVKRPGSQGDA